MRLSYRFLPVYLTLTFLCGCAGVSSINRTNQAPEYLVYSSAKDIFTTGRPYEFTLRVKRESQLVPYDSIKPRIVIAGQSYAMTKIEDWNRGASVWAYRIQDKCPNVGFASNYGFKYYFLTDYARTNLISLLLIQPPPLRDPSGEYHSRVFDAGTFHFDPTSGVTYDQVCWDTNMQCVPTFNREVVVTPGTWPGPPAQFESTLTLRNLEQQDQKLARVDLVSYQGNPPNTKFELVGINQLPVTVGCEQTFSFKIRYKPGYYQDPNFGRGAYHEQGMIQTWVVGPNGQLVGGPFIWIDYKVFQGAI